jgi:hypothetical protein
MAFEKRSAVNLSNQRDIGNGPYLARIISHLDPSFMGGLEVTLLREQGNTMGNDTQTYTVRCATPFFGNTGFEFMGQNTANPSRTQGEQALNQQGTAGSSSFDAYNDTQKSYGMWMVPPDVGVTVLVVFVDGDPSQGYWIGCVPPKFANHMVPALGGSTEVDLDTADKEKYGVTPSGEFAVKTLPVAEINRRINGKGDQVVDPEKIKKAVHPIADRFLEQGLLLDDIRGVTTTSSRREVPSMVFGISTPGPLDRRDGAKKANIGTQNGRTNSPVPVSRLGGTQFVMDDGDDRFQRATPAGVGPVKYANVQAGEKGDPTIPFNEYFRVRTRTGHQILMHNSEDLIYIGNAKGTTWIELTSNGKIDIYAKDSISIHTENDFNFYANRDINMEAGRNVNVKAKGRLNADFGSNIHMRSGLDMKLSIATSLDLLVGTSTTVNTGSTLDIGVGTNTKFTTQGTTDILSVGALKITTNSSMDIKVTTDGKISTGGSMNIKATEKINTTSGSDTNFKAGDKLTQNASGYFSLPAGGGTAAVTATAPDAASAGYAGTAIEAPPLSLHQIPTTAPVDWAKSKYQTGTSASIMKRVPMHEPWLLHENLAPQILTPTDTDREIDGALAPEYKPATEASVTTATAEHVMETNDYPAQVPDPATGSLVIPTNIDIPSDGQRLAPEFFAPSKYSKRTADALNSLNPLVRNVFARAIKGFVDRYFSEGWDMSVSEGLRPLARSQALYDAYKAGTGPQAASPGNSWHNYGAAADILIYKDGKFDGNNKLGAYTGFAQDFLRTNGLHNNAGANDCGHFVPLQMTKGVPKTVKSGAISITDIMNGSKNIG